MFINNELVLLQKYFVLACRTITIYRKIVKLNLQNCLCNFKEMKMI